jgi:FlaG/FlaF family flagellin (archaellin)
VSIKQNVPFRWGLTAMVLSLVFGSVAVGQSPQNDNPSPAAKQAQANNNQKTSPSETTIQPANANLSPAERKRAELLADTEKLYQLTQELKAEVAKSNKDTLSVSVVKKAQEVERLAKSIKERTKGQ